MKISEFIAELDAAKARFGDLDVAGTWEGLVCEIDADSIYRGRHSKDVPWLLMIDCDGNLYREEFEHPDDNRR